MIELALAVLALWFIALVAKVVVRLGCFFLVAGFFMVFFAGLL